MKKFIKVESNEKESESCLERVKYWVNINKIIAIRFYNDLGAICKEEENDSFPVHTFAEMYIEGLDEPIELLPDSLEKVENLLRRENDTKKSR